MINLKFAIEEVNLVFEALGNLPYIRSAQIIGNLQKQTTDEMNREKAEIEAAASQK